MQPDGVKLWYFKLRLFNQTEYIVGNFKGLQHRVEMIKGLKGFQGLKNESLWQRLNSYINDNMNYTERSLITNILYIIEYTR